jgi:hypothetical protein
VESTGVSADDYASSPLSQFRTIEVASFEEFQRYFVDPSLAPIKFEIPTRNSEQDNVCSFWFICAQLRLWSNDNPRPLPAVSVERRPAI